MTVNNRTLLSTEREYRLSSDTLFEVVTPKGRKGPNRSNQAQEANSNLNEVSYMAYGTREINKFDWIFDTGTTSHICTQRDAFIDYHPLQNSTITGIGPTPATAMGKDTVLV
jgi:short subunit dehydrogenase-like uncharacterized protein